MPAVAAAAVLLFAACGASEGSLVPAADAGTDASQDGSAGGSSGHSGTAGSPEAGPEASPDGDTPSLGTEFWAVDLPNERGGLESDTSKWPMNLPWGVIVANPGSTAATITVEHNNAGFGKPPEIVVTTTVTIEPGEVQAIDLPSREVNGWVDGMADPPGPSDTALSAAAYRITSDVPVSAVQFNTLSNGFSSDASLLLSRSALGTTYRALGWSAGNPVGPPNPPFFAGLPDHVSITVVAVEPDTLGTITPSAPVLGDGAGIAPTPAGGSIQVTLGAFDVLNVASHDLPGDLTGSGIVASKPVAVFSSAERGAAPQETSGFPNPPGHDPTDVCCTEHLEEQLRPVQLGATRYAVTHSPWRSTNGFKEADIVRVLAVDVAADVATSLPAPFDQFTLQPGEFKDIWTVTDMVLSSTSAVMVGQILVGKAHTNGTLGDPSFLLVPPVTDHRTFHAFLVPDGWEQAGVTIASPEDNDVLLDGTAPAGCDTIVAGALDGVTYKGMRCPVGEGQHKLESTKPIGAVVFGYGKASAWSYALAGD